MTRSKGSQPVDRVGDKSAFELFSEFDDICTHMLLDSLYLWFRSRKIQDMFSAFQVSSSVLDIVRRHIIERKDEKTALHEFIQ
jgi:hypothetical protein